MSDNPQNAEQSVYKVACHFDKSSWLKHGVEWLRQAKAQSLSGFIVGSGLGDDAKAKIEDFGFESFMLGESLSNRYDIFSPFVKRLSPKDRCLWIQPNMKPLAGIASESDLLCGPSDTPMEVISGVVVNFHDRVAIMDSLETRVKSVYKTLLSTKYILGSYDFWVGYLGCQTYLGERNYFNQVWPAEDLVLNFFVAFGNSFSVQVRGYPDK